MGDESFEFDSVDTDIMREFALRIFKVQGDFWGWGNDLDPILSQIQGNRLVMEEVGEQGGVGGWGGTNYVDALSQDTGSDDADGLVHDIRSMLTEHSGEILDIATQLEELDNNSAGVMQFVAGFEDGSITAETLTADGHEVTDEQLEAFVEMVKSGKMDYASVGWDRFIGNRWGDFNEGLEAMNDWADDIDNGFLSGFARFGVGVVGALGALPVGIVTIAGTGFDNYGQAAASLGRGDIGGAFSNFWDNAEMLWDVAKGVPKGVWHLFTDPFTLPFDKDGGDMWEGYGRWGVDAVLTIVGGGAGVAALKAGLFAFGIEGSARAGIMAMARTFLNESILGPIAARFGGKLDLFAPWLVKHFDNELNPKVLRGADLNTTSIPGDLAPALDNAADDLRTPAMKSFPTVTADLESLTKRGTELGGLRADWQTGNYGHSVKGKSSTVRSLYKTAAEDAGGPRNIRPEHIAEAAEDMSDVLRYTFEIERSKNYVSEVKRIYAELETKGYINLTTKDFWGSDGGYKGLNTNWSTPDGQTFEIQFHTRASFAVKTATHLPYELNRNPDLAELRASIPQETLDQMNQAETTLNDMLGRPPGRREDLANLPNYKDKSYTHDSRRGPQS